MEPRGVDVAALSAWLVANVDGLLAPFHVSLIAGGHSNLTYAVSGADDRRVVVRRPPLAHVLPSAHDVGREHRIIAALAATPVPVPPALGYCADPDVIGAPFYVMDFVDGLVLRNVPSVEASLPEPARATASESLVEALAAIHAVDPDAVGLGDLGRHDSYIARQLRRWHGQWHSSKTRELVAIDRVHDRLLVRIPPQDRAAVVHGDFRLDNCVVGTDGRVRAVLDWEICTLGDALADIGLLHVFWTGPDDTKSAWTETATTAPGFLNRDDLMARYAKASGRDLSDLDFYIAFGNWKLACILEGVYARYLGGALGDQDRARIDVFRTQVDDAAMAASSYAERLA
jgi:aminoglycoside phosphotransferase (APT) family kinase protein